MRRTISAALLLLALPAAAQPAKEPTAYDRSIAAGYKALMLCGAIFNGGRTREQAEALELTGIYPEYEAIVPTLPARVDRYFSQATHGAHDYLWSGSVSVEFDAALPPRRAEWDHLRGCSILPTGGEGNAGHAFRGPRLDPAERDHLPWPDGEAGIAPRPTPALDAAIGRAFAGAFSGRTTGVVVVRDGRIVGERYADAFGPHSAQRTWSVAKSISGSLVGIAVRGGLLDVAREGAVRGGNDLRAGIRLDHLLRMASGLHGETAGNRTDALYFGGRTVDEEGAALSIEAVPGTRFRYSNDDIVLAVRALRRALNDEARYADYPRAELFAKLGMTRTVAERDVGGNFILSSQVWSTARDLARLGIFWSNDGVWNGARILPRGWMKYMTAPSGPQPATGPGYGATMWLFGPAQGLPAGSYAAQGNRGQYVMVIPSRKLVIVRRGEDAAGAGFDIAKFSADVLAALE